MEKIHTIHDPRGPDKYNYMMTTAVVSLIKLIKEKAIRKHSMHRKTAASVLLKLFISGKKYVTTLTPPTEWSGTLFSNVNNIQSMISEDQKNITTQ